MKHITGMKQNIWDSSDDASACNCINRPTWTEKNIWIVENICGEYMN